MGEGFDYIVTGGGAAGRSLVCRLLRSPLREKRILLIDRAPKSENDRTWCFWEKKPGFFEDIVFHSWDHLWVHTDNFSRLLDIAPYSYKLIRGLDFYRFTDEMIEAHPNVVRYYGQVEALRSESAGVEVQVDGKSFRAEWCFNSIFFGQIDKSRVSYLDQHFRGWFVRANADVFDPERATLMDFRTPQHGETRFLYVLPASRREALVEVAIFSNNHLAVEEYDEILSNYLRQYVPDLSGFSVEQFEMGNIPMTDFQFPEREGRITHLGMAGGDTRASSGYTFYNIQKRLAVIIEQMVAGKEPVAGGSWPDIRARFYDKVMLRVLERGYYPGNLVFEELFRNNAPDSVLAFLNAETNLLTELGIVNSLPKTPFLKGLVRK